MDERLARSQQLCLDQASKFIAAAKCLQAAEFPHIVYHLSLLALEEVGKAGLIAGQIVAGERAGWIDRSLDSHVRKLQWAVWSPMERIDPKEFTDARDFAERAHAMRLASLYVDTTAELTAPPPSEVVSPADAAQALALAANRLERQRERGPIDSTSASDDVLQWFLATMADPHGSQQLLSRPFRERYEALGGDAREWVIWARAEIARLEREAQDLLASELAKPSAAEGSAKPKWRLNATVFSSSHALRPKILNRWNEQLKPVQLIWSGKKDELTLQITLSDNRPLAELEGRATSLAKLVVACLNIGTIGYFWFERPGFARQVFKEVRDLEHKRRLEIGLREGFWGDGRVVVLTDEHIEHAIRCMMAFSPLPDADAEPIFRPYLDGLAFIAKSDVFYDFDGLARRAFVASLGGALRRYGGWDGEQASFERCYHEAFAPIMPESENRDQMLQVLTVKGDPSESSLANLRSAKQLADLYLILVSRTAWRKILEGPAADGEGGKQRAG